MNNQFAIISKSNDGSNKVIFHQHEPGGRSQKLPIGPDLFTAEYENINDSFAEYSSQIEHARARAQKLVSAFSAQDIHLGNDVLCETSEDLQGIESISAFPALKIHGNHYYTYSTSKYVSDLSFQNIKKIKFRSASCLFSNLAARFVYADGQIGPSIVVPLRDLPTEPFSGIWVDEELTLYEFETTLRLGTLIGDIIKSLPNIDIHITLDVPRVQYYLYLVDLFNKGAVDSKLMFDWFDAVDKRSRRINNQLQERIRSRVPGRAITFTPPADQASLEAFLRSEIEKNNKNITIEQCIEAFLQKSDPILDLLAERRKVQSFRDLSHLSYISEMLHTGLGDSPQEIGIDVVSHIERRVFSYVAKFAPKVRRLLPDKTFALLCLYPRERIFTNDETWRPSLYRFDPGRYAIDHHMNEVDLFEVAKQFYL